MKKIIDNSTTILTVLFSFCFVIIIAFVQIKHDNLSPPFSLKLTAVKRVLLPAKILPYVDFGFSNIIADFYWIRAIQDFVQWNGQEDFMFNYMSNISTLDPKFEYPYLFAILAIPQNKNIETLDRVATFAQKGIDSIPSSWKIPYYLGTQYFLFTKTFEKPEVYLKIAAEVKGAPSGVYLTYSSFVAKKIKGSQAAQEFVKVIYNNTDNETIKKMATMGIAEELVTQMLEKGIAAYKAKFGKYPKDVEELQRLNFISLPPELLNSFTILINERNGSFRVVGR